MPYSITAESLLRLATMAADAPGADLDTILAALRSAEPEQVDATENAADRTAEVFDTVVTVGAGGSGSAGGSGGSTDEPSKPAKPE